MLVFEVSSDICFHMLLKGLGPMEEAVFSRSFIGIMASPPPYITLIAF
jgi:hypothetical protein